MFLFIGVCGVVVDQISSCFCLLKSLHLPNPYPGYGLRGPGACPRKHRYNLGYLSYAKIQHQCLS